MRGAHALAHFSVSGVKWHFIIHMAWACASRESQAGSMKQGVDFFFFSPISPCVHTFACAHTSCIHLISPAHTHAHSHTPVIGSSHFQLVPSFLLRSKRYEWWTCSDRVRVLACLSAGNYSSAMFACVRVCLRVCICLLKFTPFLLANPIQGCRRKALANILIHSWLESNLSWPWLKDYGGWVYVGTYDRVQTSRNWDSDSIQTCAHNEGIAGISNFNNNSVLTRKTHNLKPWMWPWIEILKSLSRIKTNMDPGLCLEAWMQMMLRHFQCDQKWRRNLICI